MSLWPLGSIPRSKAFLRPVVILGAMLLALNAAAKDAAPLTRERAISLLARGDFAALDARLNAVQQRYERNGGSEKALHASFGFFGDLRPEIGSAGEVLTAWVERYPRSYAARLARGIHYIELGLEARGTAYAGKTTDEQFEAMEDWFHLGRDDLAASLELARKPLLSHIWLMTAAMRSGPRGEVRRLYDTAVAYAPRSLELRLLYMTSLEPRWGGSHEAMESFAEQSRAALGPGSALNRLRARIVADRAYGLKDAKRFQAAHDQISQAMALYDGRGYRCARAELRAELDRWTEALQDMAVALREASPHKSCADAVWRIVVENGNLPGASGLLDDAIRRNPRHPGLLNHRGWLFQQRGDRARAYRDYALSAKLGNPWGENMAGMYLFYGWGGVAVDRDQGLALMKSAAEKGDENARANVVQALEAMGLGEQAALERKRFASLKRPGGFAWPRSWRGTFPEGWSESLRDPRVVAVVLAGLIMLLAASRGKRRR